MEYNPEEKEELKGTELYDKLQGQISQKFGNYWQGARTIDNKYNPFEYVEAGFARTLEGVGHVASAPGVSHVLRAIDSPFWVARQSVGAVLEHGLGVDPRYGHTAVGVAELIKGPAITGKVGRFLKGKLKAGIINSNPGTLVAETGQGFAGIRRGKYTADATYYKDPITKIERIIPHLIADNLTESRRALRELSERLGYTDDVVETTAKTPRSLVAPAEIGQLYLENITAYFRKRGTVDGFPALKLSDETVLRPKIRGTISGGLKVTFVDPFREQANRLRSAARRKRDNYEQNPYGDPNAFQLKRATELEGLAKDLDLVINIHGHHLDPLKLGSRFYKGLKEFSKNRHGLFDVDVLIENRAYLTGHLAKKGVFAGNHPLNNWQLPVRVHKGVHDFLKYRLTELGWDEKFWKKIEKLSPEDRIPYLNQYADLIIESQDEILRLFKEVAKGKPIPNIKARYWKQTLGPKNYKRIVEDLLSDVDLEGNPIPDDILQQILQAEKEYKRF